MTSQPFTDPTLLVSKSLNTGSDGITVDVCAFSVAEIDRLMWEMFRACLEGTPGTKAGFSRGGQPNCQMVDNLEESVSY